MVSDLVFRGCDILLRLRLLVSRERLEFIGQAMLGEHREVKRQPIGDGHAARFSTL